VARILVVEDNDPVRWTLATFLQANGYEVEQAENGEQALHRFADLPIDIVLMDLHMPVMDGLEACQRLRQSSKVPILITSTLSHPALQEQALGCGANAFVSKPLELDSLLAWVRDMSGRGGGPAPAAKPKSPPHPKPTSRPRKSKRARPAPGWRAWFSAWSVRRVAVAYQGAPAACPPVSSMAPLQVVQPAEKLDLSPPFEYTTWYGA
jgi:CheY-like chemotaxis protein